MLFPNRWKNPKILMATGTACLAVALLLSLIIHPASAAARDWSHGVSGFLLGLSIVLNLWAVRLRTRPRWCGGDGHNQQ